MDKAEFTEMLELARAIWEEGSLSIELAGSLAVDLYRRGWRKLSSENVGSLMKSFYSDEVIDGYCETAEAIFRCDYEKWQADRQAKKNNEEGK